MKRRFVWLSGTLFLGSLVGLLALSWFEDRHLLHHAHPLASTSQLQMQHSFYSMRWLNNHEFLYLSGDREDEQSYCRFDTRTQKGTALADLTRILGMQWLDEVSPDGMWALTEQYKNDSHGSVKRFWVAATMDGTRSLTWPCKRTSGDADWSPWEEYNSYVRWLKDGRHLVEFVTNHDEKGVHIQVFARDVITGAVTTCRFEGIGLPRIGGMNLAENGQAIAPC